MAGAWKYPGWLTSCDRGRRSPEEQGRLDSRMAQVYAGFCSYTDDQMGRLLNYLEEWDSLITRLLSSFPTTAPSGEGGPDPAQRTKTNSLTVGRTTSRKTSQNWRSSEPLNLQPLPEERLGLGLRHAEQNVQAITASKVASLTRASSPGRRR